MTSYRKSLSRMTENNGETKKKKLLSFRAIV